MKMRIPIRQFIEDAGLENSYTIEEDMEYFADHINSLEDLRNSYIKGIEVNGVFYDMAKMLELAEEDERLEEDLIEALRRGEESGYLTDWSNKQTKELQEWLQGWAQQIEYILEQPEGAKPCITKAHFDERMQEVVIECDSRKAGKAIMEILNAQGMFYAPTYTAWLAVGPYTPTSFVEAHTHYFFNQKLIDSIWGFINAPSINLDAYPYIGDFDDKAFEECAKEAIENYLERKEKKTKDYVTHNVPLESRK